MKHKAACKKVKTMNCYSLDVQLTHLEAIITDIVNSKCFQMNSEILYS